MTASVYPSVPSSFGRYIGAEREGKRRCLVVLLKSVEALCSQGTLGTPVLVFSFFSSASRWIVTLLLDIVQVNMKRCVDRRNEASSPDLLVSNQRVRDAKRFITIALIVATFLAV